MKFFLINIVFLFVLSIVINFILYNFKKANKTVKTLKKSKEDRPNLQFFVGFVLLYISLILLINDAISDEYINRPFIVIILLLFMGILVKAKRKMN